MLKCDINRNMAHLSVDIYLRDNNYNYKYKEGLEVEQIKRESIYTYMEPFISLHYEHFEVVGDAIAEYVMKGKLEEGTALSAKNSHINDLNRVLNHFMAKDKK